MLAEVAVKAVDLTGRAGKENAPPAVDARRTASSVFHAAKTAGSGRGSRCLRTGQIWLQCPHWMQASVTVG